MELDYAFFFVVFVQVEAVIPVVDLLMQVLFD